MERRNVDLGRSCSLSLNWNDGKKMILLMIMRLIECGVAWSFTTPRKKKDYLGR